MRIILIKWRIPTGALIEPKHCRPTLYLFIQVSSLDLINVCQTVMHQTLNALVCGQDVNFGEFSRLLLHIWQSDSLHFLMIESDLHG